MRICGSIELDLVMGDCFNFLKQFMPVNTISFNIYDPDVGAIQNVAQKTDNESISFSIGLSPPPLVEDPERFYRSGEK